MSAEVFPEAFSEELRDKAVAIYALTGNAKRVEEIIGVASNTIRQWKTRPWWASKMRELIAERDFKIESAYSDLVEIAQNTVKDRLEKGELVINAKGEEVRKPVKMMDAAHVMATASDKKKDARSSTGNLIIDHGLEGQLKSIAEQFASFVKEKAKQSEPIDITPEEPNEV